MYTTTGLYEVNTLLRKAACGYPPRWDVRCFMDRGVKAIPCTEPVKRRQNQTRMKYDKQRIVEIPHDLSKTQALKTVALVLLRTSRQRMRESGGEECWPKSK
jgi:hypothetical protein